MTIVVDDEHLPLLVVDRAIMAPTLAIAVLCGWITSTLCPWNTTT